MPENEIDKFLAGLPGEDKQVADIFAEQEEEEPAPEKDEVTEDAPVKDDEPRKNRKHRRWETRLREKELELEREKARLEALVRVPQSPTFSEVPAEWIALYGDTPEAKRAWELNERLINDRTSKAKEEAVREFEERQTKAAQEQKQFEDFIDTELEEIEDQFDVDLTSDTPAARKARREFLELVKKASPKDADGNITAYADFEFVFEQYQSTKTRADASKAKELSARTMVKSDSGAPKPKAPTPGFDGWKRDMGIN